MPNSKIAMPADIVLKFGLKNNTIANATKKSAKINLRIIYKLKMKVNITKIKKAFKKIEDL
jgi:hypothetical protein